MKKYISWMASAVMLIIGTCETCPAKPAVEAHPDPMLFVELIETGSVPAAPARNEQDAPGEVGVEATPQFNIQRLLEEAHLVLKNIAAEATTARAELQADCSRALDKIRSCLERLPPVPPAENSAASASIETTGETDAGPVPIPVTDVPIAESSLIGDVELVQVPTSAFREAEDRLMRPGTITWDSVQPPVLSLIELPDLLRALAQEAARIAVYVEKHLDNISGDNSPNHPSVRKEWSHEQ